MEGTTYTFELQVANCAAAAICNYEPVPSPKHVPDEKNI